PPKAGGEEVAPPPLSSRQSRLDRAAPSHQLPSDGSAERRVVPVVLVRQVVSEVPAQDEDLVDCGDPNPCQAQAGQKVLVLVEVQGLVETADGVEMTSLGQDRHPAVSRLPRRSCPEPSRQRSTGYRRRYMRS